jgi:ABC-2 type transport system permease protein
MSKFWLIFRNEYLRHVKRKRFIFALLSMPLFVGLMVGVGLLAVWADYDGRPVAYVDQSGIFANARPVPAKSDSLFPPLQIIPYQNENAARTELLNRQVQAFFLIDPAYMETGKVTLFTVDPVKETTRIDFQNFLRYNLITNFPPQTAERLINGPDIVVQSLNTNRNISGNEFVNFLMPLLAGLLFIVVVNTSGSYLVQALVEEKENRTMEIVITSVSHGQLMSGKVAGNLAVGLTELLVWLAFGFLGFFIAQRYIPGAENIQIGSEFVILMILTLLPAFVMVAGLMAAIGATSSDSREAQQWAGLFTLPIIIPFWLIVPLTESPNSLLAIALSLIPITSPITMPLRAAFTEVPLWQTAACLVLLLAGAVGSLWLAGRTFRAGMLRYGKRISLREVLRKAA